MRSTRWGVPVLLVPLVLGGACARLVGPPRIALAPSLARPDALAAFTLDGSGSWEVRGGELVLAKAGTPAGAIRRPSALAILKSRPLRRATVRLQVKSTAPPTVRERDLQVIFGYESPTRFYYVHLAGITNDVHNGIFLVADADRRRIDAGTALPALKDQEWHRVRVERDGESGLIEVFVDDMRTPLMRATDTTIRAGRVGVGSFDDTGEFRDISVTGSPP
jgi:hypothetical protein